MYIHIYPDHCERYTKMGREKKVGERESGAGEKLPLKGASFPSI